MIEHPTGHEKIMREAPVRQPKRTRSHPPLWVEVVVVLTVAVALALVIKALFVVTFYIPSPSMEPAFVKDDRIVVQRVSYWGNGTPQRGDIVVFKDPGGWLHDPSALDSPLDAVLARIGVRPSGGHLVKRVIATAGDTITCCDAQGRISVNGTPLNEQGYISPQSRCNGPMIGDCRWTAGPVPDGHIFVMGDNRDHSADSTVHMCRTDMPCNPTDGFVNTDLVVGKVFALWWPRDHTTLLRTPATFDRVRAAPSP
jgi:signal peptidase I